MTSWDLISVFVEGVLVELHRVILIDSVMETGGIVFCSRNRLGVLKVWNDDTQTVRIQRAFSMLNGFNGAVLALLDALA
jgi:hypothetical protein